MRHAGGLSPSIAGMVVAALVALGLGVLGALLYQRHRRRQCKGIFAPAAASSDKRGSISSLRGTCSTADETATSSAIGDELYQVAFQINPADIVIDLDERGNKVMLGKGSFGKVRSFDGLQTITGVWATTVSTDWQHCWQKVGLLCALGELHIAHF